jgi:hypothetical protein
MSSGRRGCTIASERMAMNIIHVLKEVLARFDREGIEYALCGGLAMAVYALPRATLDIDLMIETESLERATAAVEALGFTASGPPMKLRGGSVSIVRLRRIDPGDSEVLLLDLLLVSEATCDAWRGRRSLDWEGRKLTVVSPEGLILLKTLRHSGTDQDDIAHLKGILDED